MYYYLVYSIETGRGRVAKNRTLLDENKKKFRLGQGLYFRIAQEAFMLYKNKTLTSTDAVSIVTRYNLV